MLVINKMWTRSKEALSMGVQAVSSPSKRKQDFDTEKDKKFLGANPIKLSKWNNSNNNSNNSTFTNRSNNVESVDNIALLEVLSGISCEPWNIEPTDTLSRLQAISVPDDPWGSNCNNNKSTFETASLLDFDDVDVEDNDYEDDYEKEQNTTPLYGLKYNCSSQRVRSPSLHGYIKASFYSDSFLQHNGSKIPPNSLIKMSNFSWGNSNNSNNYCTSNENSYSQQIKCAENGKSYLELGNSNFSSTLDAKRAKKCCDGRGAWCNGKSCYKEIRLRVRSISMFKLSRFRQISEQSLYRSVLICNTLKQIEKEIDSDNKESNNKTNSNFSLSQGLENIKPLNSINTIESSENDFEQSVSSYNLLNTTTENKNFKYTYNSNLKQNSGSSNSFFYCNDNTPQSQDYYSFRDSQSGRATPFPNSMYNTNTDSDSGYGDDESSRSINWSSVLSLSSQSALDPLNNNDLFSTLSNISSTNDVASSSVENSSQYSNSSSSIISNSSSSSNQTSHLSHLSPSSSATLEYNFLDMDLGLGQEFTELSPSCKFSSNDMFKAISTSLNSNKYSYENDLEPPTHIMVGS